MSRKSLVKRVSFSAPSQKPEIPEILSLDPSYTRLLTEISYDVICRERIQSRNKALRRQFHNEILEIGRHQIKAIDFIRTDQINPKREIPSRKDHEPVTFDTKRQTLQLFVVEKINDNNEISFVMFANTFQSGFVSIFYSVGSNPLMLWDKQVKNGHIRRVVDDEVRSLVLEISGTNVATTYITCPIKPRLSLGIKLPFLVMIIKNMKKYFTFEIQILDDKDMHRRFRVSNFQSTTKVRPFCTTMPIGLSSGWNQVQFNLADFTKRAYGSTYLETTRVQIHANVRIRRIYFSDMLYTDEELPNEYKLFVPTPGMPAPPRPSKTEKKESIAKKKPSQVEAPQEGVPTEGEPPPPSPAVEEMPPPTPMAESEAPTESENLAEPPSEKLEETVTEDLTTAEPTTTTLTEGEGEAVETVEGAEGEQVPVEQAAQEGELKVEGVEIVGEAPAETPGEAPAESPGEAPAESVGEAPDKKISVAPPAETEAEVPKEGEAVVVEETPVEVEAPQEAAPSVTEEAPAESPAVEEPAPEQEAAEAT